MSTATARRVVATSRCSPSPVKGSTPSSRASTAIGSNGSTAPGASPSESSIPGWSATCRATCERPGSDCKETAPPGVVHPMETVAVPGPGEDAGRTPVAPTERWSEFAELYRTEHRRMLRLAVLLTSSTEVAQDVVQDSFVRL